MTGRAAGASRPGGVRVGEAVSGRSEGGEAEGEAGPAAPESPAGPGAPASPDIETRRGSQSPFRAPAARWRIRGMKSIRDEASKEAQGAKGPSDDDLSKCIANRARPEVM